MRPIILLIGIMAICTATMAQSITTIENEFIKIITAKSGLDHPRFSIETTGGDPSHDRDNELPLIYGRPKPWTSYTSIAIGNDVYGFGEKSRRRAGKTAKYGTVVTTNNTDSSLQTTVQMGPIVGTQTLSFFRNPLTNVNDSVLIHYTLTNTSQTTHLVGLRMMMDTMLGTNDASPFRIGASAVVSETIYTGDEIADYWQSFDRLSQPNIVAQGLLRHAPSKLTPPDDLILMNWGTLADHPYNVTVTKGASFIREGEDEPDTALALMYRQQPLAPNETRHYRTVMGLGGISVSPGDVSLGLTAPSALAIGDSNTYTIIAYIVNNGGFTVKNARAILNLPVGVTLVSESSTHSLGDMLPNGSRQLMYRIKVSPTTATEGDHTISLTVASDTLTDQVLRRPFSLTGQPTIRVNWPKTIMIPAHEPAIVEVPVAITNASDVDISSIRLRLNPSSGWAIPAFESIEKQVASLPVGNTHRFHWALNVPAWHTGLRQIPITVQSDYTKPQRYVTTIGTTTESPTIQLQPSEVTFSVGDYGYVVIDPVNMPNWHDSPLLLTWDDTHLKPVRVSPAPWMVDVNAIDSFVMTPNQMTIAIAPPPPTDPTATIGKWHFKAVAAGTARITIARDGVVINEQRLVIHPKKSIINGGSNP